MVKYPSSSSAQLNNQDLHRPKQTKRARKEISLFDRGMILEKQINGPSKYYLEKNLCVARKKSIPTQIVKMDYPKRSKVVIREAYFRQASTTDYNGIYKGHYSDFETKKTENYRSFPLKNFHGHQIVHLSRCLRQDDICFTITRFSGLGWYFIVPINFVVDAYKDPDKSSIALQEIETVSYEIQSGFRPTLPYLGAVDKLIANRSKS